MCRIVVTRTINAPIGLVFSTVADERRLSQVLLHIVKVEFVSDIQVGVGTRFRETRLMNGKEATTELEVTEFVENERVRLVAADSLGTVWDTVFAFAADRGHTDLTMTMVARAHKWRARIFLLLIGSMIKRAVARDMDLVKEFCEKDDC